MKKFVSFAAAAALALSVNVGAISTAAAEDGRSDYVDLCKFLVEAGIYDTVGACMSDVNTVPVDFCKAYYDFFGFKNVGQCVSYIRHLQNQ